MIYGISGLGADARIFKYLTLKYPLKTIEWIEPRKNESLNGYAQRLIKQINIQEDFILVGVSFGGMVAVELQDIIRPQKTIIISSCASRSELPLFFRFIGRTRLINLIPSSLIKPPMFIMHRIFGATSVAEKKLLQSIMEDSDSDFLKWAIEKIITWNRKDSATGLTRIHGSDDRLLPIRRKYRPVEITGTGGCHLMVISHAREISAVINSL